MELYYSRVDNAYYNVGTLYCDLCKNKLSIEHIIIRVHYKNRDSQRFFSCHNCAGILKKIRPETGLAQSTEILPCFLRTSRPEGSIVVPFQRLSLKSCTDVFDAAISNRNITADSNDCDVVDKSKLSGDSFENALIGADLGKLEDDRKILSKKEAGELIEDLKKTELKE